SPYTVSSTRLLDASSSTDGLKFGSGGPAAPGGAAGRPAGRGAPPRSSRPTARSSSTPGRRASPPPGRGGPAGPPGARAPPAAAPPRPSPTGAPPLVSPAGGCGAFLISSSENDVATSARLANRCDVLPSSSRSTRLTGTYRVSSFCSTRYTLRFGSVGATRTS